MTVLPITCDNCGAKYKLPPTFTGNQAKCQKCGSVIDVARQRAGAGGGDAPAAAKPASAKPAAAARPAVDRSKPAAKEPAKPAATARPARGTRASTRTANADDAGGDDGAPRHGGRERPAKKSNAMPLILSGVGLVGIVVALVIVFGGGDKPKTDATAKVDQPAPAVAAESPKPAEPVKPAEPAKAPDPLAPATAKPANPEPAAPEPARPAAPVAAPAEASTPPPPAEPEDPTREKRPWEKLRNPPQSMDQVTDPKSYPEPTWPADIDDAKKAELRSLAEDAADTGIRAIRARKSLAQAGYGAMFAIVERLRLLNYMSTEDSMTAYALNKVMEEITGGLNARFEPVEASETLVPAKAEWNTQSVKGWLGLLAKYQDEETFKKDRAERLKKQAEANK
ncbi:MAG: hypothetical protein JNM25_12645 [Planctomycetes bacterium]|nr:hypothetical protein [Planctomycetota bacterium]